MGSFAGVPPRVGRSVTHMEDGMKRLSLILAVSVFAGVAGGSAAQTAPEGKIPDAGSQVVNWGDALAQAESDGPPLDLQRAATSQMPGKTTETGLDSDGRSATSVSLLESLLADSGTALQNSANSDSGICFFRFGAQVRRCASKWAECCRRDMDSPEWLSLCSMVLQDCINRAEAALEACLGDN